ncbi:MAG: IS1634 family transposase, partial [Nanoarchaeota archaeon]
MFIREVTHKNKNNNTMYSTYKIVESYRTQQGPRQRTIINLGTSFSLPTDQWGILSQCIEEIITGQRSFIGYPEEIEYSAQKYARMIIRQQASIIEIKKDSAPDYEPDYQEVDINSVQNENARTVGAEHIVYQTIKELELDKKLIEMGFNKPYLDAAIGVIAARLIDPSSERAAHLWLKEISGIDELMDTDFSDLSQYRVYQVSDNLLKHKEEIEKYLHQKECSLFKLQEKVILYDLTNTFFEGSGKYNQKAHFGRSKEKRTDCPLVTMGLVLDGDGFPKRSKIFNGNVSEPATFKEAIENLSDKRSLTKPIIVMDAGIATEAN